MSNTVTQFQLGDRIAYCIEPGVEINEKYYDILYGLVGSRYER